jgi:hypothetical protein
LIEGPDMSIGVGGLHPPRPPLGGDCTVNDQGEDRGLALDARPKSCGRTVQDFVQPDFEAIVKPIMHSEAEGVIIERPKGDASGLRSS